MIINVTKLDAEIRATALPLVGVSGATAGGDTNSIAYSGCRVDLTRPLTGPERAALDGVVAAHDPTDNAAARSNVAETDAAAIPNWATWSLADWNTWYNANISSTQITAVASLADAKAIMNKMSTVLDAHSKLLVALRNRVFPRLPGP